MTLFLLAVSLLYAFFTLLLWITWLRMPSFSPGVSNAGHPHMTVIIPVRNEAATIEKLLDDLNKQTFRHFEVIVADDASTDNTGPLVRQYAERASFSLHLLSLDNERTASPKKRAITQCIAQASGDLIVTTDGDCRAGPGWLETIAAFYTQTGAKLISGPVTFADEHSLFDTVQTVEFASLIGSGACTLALGYPTMCNGANLCYEKEVFTEVGGFAGVDHLASGDDELLMHKITARYPGGARFLKNAEAIVRTGPHRSWRAFYNQRKRWASKWRAYTSYGPSVLAVFIFLSNAVPILALAGWIGGYLTGSMTLTVVGMKVIPEFVFLRQVLIFLRKKPAVLGIPLTQLIYPVYVLFFGLVAQGKGYVWKDRRLT